MLPDLPSVRLATRLAAPEPGWTVHADAVVVGSGIAGLTAALELRTRVRRVLLVTKGVLSSGSTVWAQGGIAAALTPATPRRRTCRTPSWRASGCATPAPSRPW